MTSIEEEKKNIEIALNIYDWIEICNCQSNRKRIWYILDVIS